MSITVRQLLTVRGMEAVRVIGGAEGLDREVSLANVMDSLELHEWLLGGEIILSNSLLFENNEAEIARSIQRLNHAQASGLILKTGRYIETVPQDAIDLADRLQFPLLTAPYGLHFSIVLQGLTDHSTQLSESAQRYMGFSRLLSKNVGVSAYLSLLSQYLQRDVVFYDNVMGKVIRSSAKTACPAYESPEKAQYILKNYAYAAIENGTNYGTLVVPRKDSQDEERFRNSLNELTVNYAVSMIAIARQNLLPASYHDELWLDRFIAMLLWGDEPYSEEQIRHKGRLCGFDFYQPMSVVVVQAGDPESQPELEKLLRKYVLQFPNVLLVNPENHMILLWSGNKGEGSLRLFAEGLLESCRQQGLCVTLGVEEDCADISDLKAAYASANHVLEVGKKSAGNGAAYFSCDMTAEVFLDNYANTDEAEILIESVLGKLLRYDRDKPGYQLLPTLEMIRHCGFNMKQAANEMFVHYNTLKYRYTKIGEILELDLTDFEAQHRLALALTLYRLRKKD